MVCYDPLLYPLFELCETLRFRRILHDRMLQVLYGPSFVREMFGCCPGLHVHQISCRKKTSGPWLMSDWFVIICQSLRLLSCDIVLKLHGHL
ncbi:hypothetical protein TNCV_511161 [Trichonephila clavipes]|nr:hypothetical protein TNCV_511161 [Trichonephila clavipes]